MGVNIVDLVWITVILRYLPTSNCIAKGFLCEQVYSRTNLVLSNCFHILYSIQITSLQWSNMITENGKNEMIKSILKIWQEDNVYLWYTNIFGFHTDINIPEFFLKI